MSTPPLPPDGSREKDAAYWEAVRRYAADHGSDGCTLVTQLYQDCCFEHDRAYSQHKDMWGDPITRGEADAEFRRCIQRRSFMGRFSPISYLRWFGLRIGGWFSWSRSHRKAQKQAEEAREKILRQLEELSKREGE